MSKIECGHLFPIREDGIEFRGPCQLGNRLDGTLVLRKHPRAGSSNDHPDFIVEYAAQGGRSRPLGAGWIKNSSRSTDFITMTLDDPDWASPVYLTAFSSANSNDSWPIVWSRPRGVRVQEATTRQQESQSHV